MNARILLLLAFAAACGAQTSGIATFAGGGPPTGAPSTNYGIIPQKITTDSAGNVYICTGNQVWVVNSSGVITQIIGSGLANYSGDNGPAASAELAYPSGVAVDANGNIYIADTGNNRIRKVSNGVITTIAGTGQFGDSGDGGAAINASLGEPTGMAVDSSGNVYFVDRYDYYGGQYYVCTYYYDGYCESGYYESEYDYYPRIRKISTNGIISTVAGSSSGFSGDGGAATSAQLGLGPGGVAVDSNGNLYIADSTNCRIRKVANGIISTIAGNGTCGYSGDGGSAVSAELDNPQDVAVNSSGNVYIADGSYRIRQVAGGTITTVAGNGTYGYSGDGAAATSAELYWPVGVAFSAGGNLYIADADNYRVREVSGGIITTFAGNGSSGRGGDGGIAIAAQLYSPTGVATDSTGNVYIVDSGNNVVRNVSGGIISTVAGNGTPGYSGDGGSATAAELHEPFGLALDSSGNLYIADTDNCRVRKVAGGVISTVAGNGTCGYSGDGGAATSAELSYLGGVAVDSSGNLYIADQENCRVRKVSSGVISTVAGNGTCSYSGDGGAATSAGFTYPGALAVDSSGNLYIADYDDDRIRKISGGIISTVAGNGTCSYSGDGGAATSAELCEPYGVAVDASGKLYISDLGNGRIREVSGGVITTVAGDGGYGFSGDGGPATSAEFAYPGGLAVSSNGDIYVADENNKRIRVAGTQVAVQVTSAPAGLTVTVDGTAVTTPQAFTWIAGTPHTISASSQAGAAGVQYSSSYASTSSYTYTGSTQTVTVPFTTQYYLSTSASAGGSISPASGWYNSGATPAVSATANTGYSFTGFSGALTGTTTPQNLTMTGPLSVAAGFGANQTITFGPLPNEPFGAAPIALSATATSGLAVSFASTTSSVCTVLGSTVMLAAPGTCTIQATQTGNASYAAATPVNQSFQVTQGSQTITFGSIANVPFSPAPVGLAATASSNLPVSFNSQTTAVCTVSGATAALVTAGICTIQATQAGDANYAAAPPVSQSFQVMQASQTITFGSIANVPFSSAPVGLAATASSNLPVSFNSQTTAVCTVAGATVTLVTAGTCTIQATQAGNANYAAALPVSQSFQVMQASQTITFGSIANVPFSSAPVGLAATASSHLPVSFNSQSTAVCTVSGASVTLVTAGICTIQATQAGNANYAAAPPVSQSFQVTATSQPITFATNPSGLLVSVDGATAQAAPFTLSLQTGPHTIAVAGIQAGSPGTQYQFTAWSDLGAASHSITVGASAATYTANFQTQYQLITAASPSMGGTVTPLSGGYYPAGSSVTVQATSNSGYQFANFSGGISGASSSQSVTMNGPENVVANFTPLTPKLAATVGTRTVSGGTVLVTLTLTNTGLGAANDATITGITGFTDVSGTGAISVASGTPIDLGTIGPGSSATTTVTLNWPSTAPRVSFTVNFTADGGYAGSSTITTLY